MRLDLHPLVGIGPVRLGSPLPQAESALASLDGYLEPDPFRRKRGSAHFRSGLSITLGSDGAGLVVSIEVHRSGSDSVDYDGLDLFQTPADLLIDELRRRTELWVEEGGRTIIAPILSMSIWRSTIPDSDDDEDGRYFESALVAREGYFALPG